MIGTHIEFPEVLLSRYSGWVRDSSILTWNGVSLFETDIYCKIVQGFLREVTWDKFGESYTVVFKALLDYFFIERFL